MRQRVIKDAMWIRERLAAGDVLTGSHIFCGAPMLTETIANQGFDIVWVDLEHTSMTTADAVNNVIAVRAGGAASLVRIAWNDPARAKPILDMGPDIILFPNILDFEDAQKAVQACKYPPLGVRGFGPQRASGFGDRSAIDYMNDPRTLIAVQIEKKDAVRDLDKIAGLEGIDLFIVGPCDLSISMGHPGRLNDPEMLKVYDEIGATLTRHHRPFGVSVAFNPDDLRAWKERGAQLLFTGFDTIWVHDGARDTIQAMREIIRG